MIAAASPITLISSQTTQTYRASSSIGPRQVVAMNDLRISLTNYPDINYLLETGHFDNLTEMRNEDETNLNPEEFFLYQNYPNPFNPGTTINFHLNNSGKVTLKIFDTLGKEIQTLIDEYFESGFHSKFYILNPKLSSGVYFYRLSTPNYSQTKSMVLLK